MNSNDMPLMMDNSLDPSAMAADMEVDALFGDVGVGAVDLPFPRGPISKQLLCRIDEMRRTGCCQGIAWSRAGTVASIAPDGRSVELRFLRCHPETAVWDLSEPTLYPFPSATASNPIVHLAWAPTHHAELAVVDLSGRVAILTFSTSLNRPLPTRKWDADQVDSLESVVGSYWLGLIPQNKQYHILYGPAVKHNAGYRYESSYIPAFGPYHPIPAKSAFVCVTTGGMVKMYWSQNSNRVEETTLELESPDSADDLITHAAICSDKMSLYVVTSTASGELRVRRINISWGIPDKQVSGQLLSPTLAQQHIDYTTWPQDEWTDRAGGLQLSLLEILPQHAESANVWHPPVILAARTIVPSPSASFHESVETVLDRWELVADQPQALHSAFEQLASRRNSTITQPKPVYRLKRLQPLVWAKALIHVHSMQFGKVVCFVFSDGSVEYRDRATWNEVYNSGDLTRLTTLNETGMVFSQDAPCLQVAFSPTNCSMAQIMENGKVKWNCLHHVGSEVTRASQDPRYTATVAALTVIAASANLYSMNYDDLLAIARPFAADPLFANDWITEIVRMLKIPVDYSDEAHHDNLVRNSSLQLCLSIMNHLGFRGDFHPRSFGSKFAMLALNVRNIVILITIASNAPVGIREKLSPLDEHEVVDALAGCAKWSLDLVCWLADCLFQLLDDPVFLSFLTSREQFNDMTQYLQSKNDVSLHLLLCSSTRGFISAVCRRLLHLDSISNRAIQYYEQRAAAHASQPNSHSKNPPLALHIAYQKMQNFTSNTLIKVAEFDKLLNALTSDIRESYRHTFSKLPSDEKESNEAAIKRAQTYCELRMLLASSPPPNFLSVVSKFFHTDLRAFRAKTDPGALFFYDCSLLEVDDDRRSLARRRREGHYVDVFKRVELRAPVHGTAGGPGSGATAARPYVIDPNELPGNGGAGGPGAAAAGGATNGTGAGAFGSVVPPQWRRCARCASVMEDVWGHRPGFSFVLGQQRKCSCGGSWGLLPRGALVS